MARPSDSSREIWFSEPAHQQVRFCRPWDQEVSLPDLVRRIEANEKKRKRYFNAVVILTLVASGLLAGLIALGVIHARHVARCNIMSPGDMASNDTPAVPEAPPVGRRLVVTPVGIKHARPTLTHYPFGNSTRGPPDVGEQCEPGSVYGGQELDDPNHGYMALMQKALSISPPAMAGEVRDYYHASLRSIFLCDESMDVELVAACKTGYVVDGDEVECDEDGSYGDSASPSASA